MDRAKFFAALRGGAMFPNGFTQDVVEGFDNLLDVWEKYYSTDPLNLLAYNLGTAFHETAATMQPIKERGPKSYFNKYEPGTKIGKVLGNTVPGDGYKFRGEGHVQNTGRRNAQVATRRLNEEFNLGIDLVKNPEKRGDPFISAHSLFLGNKEGWWTGKDLLDFIDDKDEDDAEDLREFIEARCVVNGTDKARKIAEHALEFEKALKAAGYDGKAKTLEAGPHTLEPTPKVTPKVIPNPEPAKLERKPSSGNWLAAIIEIIAKIFGARK